MVAQHVSQLHSPCQLSFTSLTFAVKTETLQFPCYVAPGLLLRWSMNINTSQHVSLPETWQIINLVADRHNMVSVCSHRLPKISRNIAQRYGYVLKPAQTQSSSYTDLQIPHKVHFLQLQKIFFFFFLSEYGYLDDSMKETGVIFHTIHYSFHMRQRQSPSSLQLLSCILGIFAQDRLFWTMSGTEQYGITKKKWVCVGGSSARKKTSSPKRKGAEWGRLPL